MVQDVEKESEVPFGWSNFEVADPKLQVEVHTDEQALLIPVVSSSVTDLAKNKINALMNSDKSQSLQFCLDDLNEVRRENFVDNVKRQPVVIYVSVYRDEKFKVIEFAD